VNVVGKDFREDFLNGIGWVKEETFSHLPSLFLTVWNSGDKARVPTVRDDGTERYRNMGHDLPLDLM
jgi:hypothetical protein